MDLALTVLGVMACSPNAPAVTTHLRGIAASATTIDFPFLDYIR